MDDSPVSMIIHIPGMSSDEIIVQDHERGDAKEPGKQTAFPKFGCIAVILLGAFFIGILIAALLIGSQMAEDIESFTDESQKEVPVERGTTQELADLRSRILTFIDKLRSSPSTPVELRLSIRDLNILVANDGYLGDLRGTIYFRKFLTPDILQTERSRPMARIKFWKPRRYLNAQMDYRLVAQEGNISLFAEAIRMEDRETPDYVLQKFKSQDMLSPYKNDERFLEVLKMLKDARIEGDSVILSNTSPPSLPGTRQAP